MKVAFTYNLKMTECEEDAEFDTLATVTFIRDALSKLGHEVHLLEVSGPVSRVISRLEAINPDLVFNTAEGRRGPYREAFYPAIFEQLGLPYTGSDAYTCQVTLDKKLTKNLVSEIGILTPRFLLIRTLKELSRFNLEFPVIVKPNFEGSSKGITPESVVEDRQQLLALCKKLLSTHQDGLLIEEFIIGKDITVPYLELIGALTPCGYQFDQSINESRKYEIYDYTLKNELSDKVTLNCPPDLSPLLLKQIQQKAQQVFEHLNIRDMGRADFRLTESGQIYFIEVNALPSLEQGASIFESAKVAGIKEDHQVIETVIEMTLKRYGLHQKKNIKHLSPSSLNRQLKVGFAYNQKRAQTEVLYCSDAEAEFDSPTTLDSIRAAIKKLGHEVVDLEANSEFPSLLLSSQVDVVFNISEGIRGAYREAQVPAILELLDIPYTGSDPSTLSLAMDKGIAKKVVAESGVCTPQFLLMMTGREKIPPHMEYPFIVKPVAEGSSKGVLTKCVVHTEQECRQVAMDLIRQYRQAAIVEEFLTGREFTVAMLGEKRPKILPPMEIIFKNRKNPFPIYNYHHKLQFNEEVEYAVPAVLDDRLKKQLERAGRKVFMALGCRDLARVDFRLDRKGRVNFIECNPLPGLSPGWSDFCMIAESCGIDYVTLIGEILAPAIKRFKMKQRNGLWSGMKEELHGDKASSILYSRDRERQTKFLTQA